MEAKYKRLEPIARGSVGQVYRCCARDTGEIMAYKKIVTDASNGVPSTVIREVSLLKELQHENIIRALNANNFTGGIPPSLGSLSELLWLDFSDNQLTGTIPVSTSHSPGLDLLLKAKHFHFNKNKLSGNIPPKLFSSKMTLLHILFDGNQLTGSIPSTLGLVQTLEVIRLDRNSLTGEVPSSLNNLANVNELNLAHNSFTGQVPNLSGMKALTFVDLSNNSFVLSHQVFGRLFSVSKMEDAYMTSRIEHQRERNN